MSAYARESIERLANIVQPQEYAPPPDSAPITVHAAVSRFAVLYEKIRNAVDYKDDHLLRKSAILRILKRQLALEGDAEAASIQLIRELIAARYLPNAVLPESLFAKVATVIQKYLVISRIKIADEKYDEWLFGIIAAELEELVDDHTQMKGFINFMYEQLADKVLVDEDVLSDTDRRLQVYIACHRSLIKADDEMVGFKLARAYQPLWMAPEQWVEAPHEMAENMVRVYSSVQVALTQKLGQKFIVAVKPWAISLNILRTALNESPVQAAELLQNPEALHAAVERIAERRMKEAYGRLRRGTVRAIIYLFITKIFIALALEIPSELALYHQVNNAALLTNITFPPMLMFLVGSMIRMPGKENVKRIKLGVDELLSEDGPPEKRIRIQKTRGTVSRFVFGLVYAGTFIVTFGLIISGLKFLHFTGVSSVIFIFFLSVVSFFAFRLRISAKEFVAVVRPDRLTTMILDFFSLPVLRAGRWLSETFSRFNLFIFFFDFIVEAPFKIFLNVLEEWSAFMKEKKEQLE